MQLTKKSLVLTLAGAAAAVLLAGCFDVEESVSLQRDLSGKAGFKMTVDLEPMVAFMAAMGHSMSGQPGEPTPAELEKARKDFLEHQKQEEPAKKQEDFAAKKAELEKALPPGIKLLSAAVDDQGLRVVAHFEFGFDDVRKLAQIKMPEKAGEEKKGQNPYDDPFSGLKVVDEGPTVLVTFSGVDPKTRLQDRVGKEAPSPDMQKQFAAAFGKARFAFRLDTPFQVFETNATRREGHTLYWEIKASDANPQLPSTLMARFKK
jgi:hypothetical protein